MVNSHRAEMLASYVFPLNFTLNIPCPGPTYSNFEYSLGFTPFLSIPVVDDPYSLVGLLTANLCPLQN